MKTFILIDVSLTGGRGPAKQAYEFIQDCRANKISYQVVSDCDYVRKIRDVGINADIVVDTKLNEAPSVVIGKFRDSLRSILFEYLVKFGARMAGPTVAYERKVPYIIVDGGLPDILEGDGLYSKQVISSAQKYLLTTQFDWKFPPVEGLKNIEVTTYPLSRQTIQRLREISQTSREKLMKRIQDRVKNLSSWGGEKLVYLMITGDLLKSSIDRKTFGGWLTTLQYDELVGFVRRFVNDLGFTAREKFFVLFDKELYEITSDLFQDYRDRLVPCYCDKWDFEAEIYFQKIADIVISRAANYQPYLQAMGNGGLITTAVPARGYMDEDTAALQAEALGLTKVISYDSEKYIFQFYDFLEDRKRQLKVLARQKKNFEYMIQNKNCNEIILKTFQLL